MICGSAFGSTCRRASRHGPAPLAMRRSHEKRWLGLKTVDILAIGMATIDFISKLDSPPEEGATCRIRRTSIWAGGDDWPDSVCLRCSGREAGESARPLRRRTPARHPPASLWMRPISRLPWSRR
jgi:hypothetical protein